jgi:hypothetical protein
LVGCERKDVAVVLLEADEWRTVTSSTVIVKRLLASNILSVAVSMKQHGGSSDE